MQLSDMTTMVRGSGEPPHKMAKLDTPLPANVIIQFQSDTGDTVGELSETSSMIQLRSYQAYLAAFYA